MKQKHQPFLTILFSAIFPTKITSLGKRLFYITNENDYIARQTRLQQVYKLELDPERATHTQA